MVIEQHQQLGQAVRFPNLPRRIKKLPVDHRGFPVPRFVQWFDEEGHATKFGVGRPDFRVADQRQFVACIKRRLCWICGDKLGKHIAFVIGPMCGVNRINSEPPSHRDCAIFAAETCPFLSRPLARRREGDLPEDHIPAAGVAIQRNPGACAVWVTDSYTTFRPHIGADGVLLQLGEPSEVLWYTEGRRATFLEIDKALEGGLPSLLKIAETAPNPEDELRGIEEALKRLEPWLPPRDPTPPSDGAIYAAVSRDNMPDEEIDPLIVAAMQAAE